MSFAFDPSDTDLQAALRRLARKQCDDALAATTGDGPLPERLHAMRLSVKRSRALLRLVAPGLDEADRADRSLRDAARHLAPLRDTHVVQDTLAGLAKASPAEDLVAAIAPGGDAIDATEAIRAFTADMTRLRRRAAGWKLDGPDADILRAGLAHTARRARRLHREAMAEPSPETLHAWRRHVKHHFYHAKLLTPVWPELIGPHADAANRLGEILGLHHDVAVLADRLSALKRKDAKSLLSRAKTRQSAHWHEADALGARLFAEKPAALADRWVALWQVWRAGG
jgi:CHAD domain-containing protein